MLTSSVTLAAVVLQCEAIMGSDEVDGMERLPAIVLEEVRASANPGHWRTPHPHTQLAENVSHWTGQERSKPLWRLEGACLRLARIYFAVSEHHE